MAIKRTLVETPDTKVETEFSTVSYNLFKQESRTGGTDFVVGSIHRFHSGNTYKNDEIAKFGNERAGRQFLADIRAGLVRMV